MALDLGLVSLVTLGSTCGLASLMHINRDDLVNMTGFDPDTGRTPTVIVM